jgi:hypothetical protein
MSRSSTATPAGGLDLHTGTEPIIAWRAWALTGGCDGTDLLLRPVARRSRPWKPRQTAEAACSLVRFHRAPHAGCTCGLHGTHEIEILRKTRCPAVLGRVALWGTVIEHDFGYRARFAYPQRVKLICQFCFWQSGPHGAPPTQVGWFPKDDLMPICEEHLGTAARYGLQPRGLLEASEVEQRLRETYAVDALAV